MLLHICEVFYIFVLNFQVFLINKGKFPCGNSLLGVQLLTRQLHCTMYTWEQSEKARNEWLHRISNEKIQAPGQPPFFTLYHLPTLKDSTRPTKRSCYSKNLHSLIPSHCNFFITLEFGMWLLYMATNSNQYWSNSYNTIQFFLCPRPIK